MFVVVIASCTGLHHRHHRPVMVQSIDYQALRDEAYLHHKHVSHVFGDDEQRRRHDALVGHVSRVESAFLKHAKGKLNLMKSLMKRCNPKGSYTRWVYLWQAKEQSPICCAYCAQKCRRRRGNRRDGVQKVEESESVLQDVDCINRAGDNEHFIY